MRLFHNIFYRKFKSLPISYYKRGKELIVAETFTSSVSASFNLSQVEILPDYFEDKSNFEDYAYCMELKRLGLIKTEVEIKEPVYHYRYQNYDKLY